MSSSRGQFKWDSGKLTANVKRLPADFERILVVSTEMHGDRGQAALRQNAPWRDVTSNARNGLFTKVRHVPFVEHGIAFAHSVPYGIWLEVRFSGRYAVIMPTVKSEGEATMKTITAMLARRLRS